MAGRKKPTARQVEQWIVHVIQPVLRALEGEIYWLQRGTSSWRFHNESLEYYQPIRSWVLADALPIVEQFLRFVPQIVPLVDRHDEAVVGLHHSAKSAFDALAQSAPFRAAVRAEHGKFEQEAPESANWQGAFPAEKRPLLAAQYVINRVQPNDVGPGQSLFHFWRDHGAALLEHRSRPDSAEAIAQLDASLETLETRATRLKARLERERDQYADRFGLPPVILA